MIETTKPFDPTDTRRRPANDTSAPALISKFIWDGDRQPAPPVELIEDTVGDRSILFIGGQSGAGKSFVMMTMAWSLMLGTPFFGRAVTRRVGVVVLAPEGDKTLVGRLAALRLHYGDPGGLPFAYLGAVPDLALPANRLRLVDALKECDRRMQMQFGLPLGIVFMDTLAATFDLKDENDNSEAARTIRYLSEIRDAVGVTVAPVHHYGKTAETGLRGASGWRAGVDELLSVVAERNEITGETSRRELSVAKHRDAVEGPIAPFELQFVRLGQRPSGKAWGSLVVIPRLDQPVSIGAVGTRKPSMTKNLRTFEEAFEEAMIEGAQPFKIADGPTVRAVRVVPDLKDKFFQRYQTGTDDPERSPADNEKKRIEAKRKAFQRAMGNHAAKFATEERHGVEWIWSVAGTSGTGRTSGTF